VPRPVSSARGHQANLSAAWMQRLMLSSASLMAHMLSSIVSFPGDKSVVLVVECCVY
jgi:hypothetical protein